MARDANTVLCGDSANLTAFGGAPKRQNVAQATTNDEVPRDRRSVNRPYPDRGRRLH